MHTIEAITPAAGQAHCAVETYRCGALSATGRTDTLRSLLRQMTAAGLTGSARVYDDTGRHCLTIQDIAAASAWTLSEENARGFILRRFSKVRAEAIAALRQSPRCSALHLSGAA